MEVHAHLGPGLRAEVYKRCLIHELRMRELILEEDAPVAIRYKGVEIAMAATHDLVIENSVVVRVLAEDEMLPLHKESLKNQLRLSRLETGFLVNFNVLHLRANGIKRIIVSSSEPVLPYVESPATMASKSKTKTAKGGV